MIHRSFRFRLAPTSEQAEQLQQTAGVIRLVYNLALAQRRDFYRQYWRATGRRLTWMAQWPELKALRAEFAWVAAVSATAQLNAIRDVDRAFANYFSGRSRFPSPRCRGIHDSFRFKGYEVNVRQLNGKWSLAWLPKIGWVKFRNTREMRGRALNVTVAHDAQGWRIVFTNEIEHEARLSALPSIGIDRGIANTLALSNGELFSTADTARLEQRKRKAQRVLARRKRGSDRYRKQRRRVARLQGRIARVRADWRHKITLGLAQRFGTVALEDLRVKNMTGAGRGKRGLNRSILEQGWRAFETVLAYKLEERGGSLVKVNPAFTSQECSACGTIDRASRESQASFACRSCGFAAHADTNAAINILRRSTASMRVEDRGCPADETRTVNLAA